MDGDDARGNEISGVPNWAATTIAGEWQSVLAPDFTDLDEGIAEIEAANVASTTNAGTSLVLVTWTCNGQMGSFGS